MTADRLAQALELIASTDPVDAALDPQRAVRVAREALAAHRSQAPAEGDAREAFEKLAGSERMATMTHWQIFKAGVEHATAEMRLFLNVQPKGTAQQTLAPPRTDGSIAFQYLREQVANSTINIKKAWSEWRDLGQSISVALDRGEDPALILDENSPLRDEPRRLVKDVPSDAAQAPAPAPVANIRCAACDKPAVNLGGMFPSCPCGSKQFNGEVSYAPAPQAPAVVDDDVRELRKWLNEEPNRPIDRTALARVLASQATVVDGSADPLKALKDLLDAEAMLSQASLTPYQAADWSARETRIRELGQKAQEAREVARAVVAASQPPVQGSGS